MRHLSLRGIISACAVTGACAAAAALPTAAAAAGEQCSGEGIRGKGSSAQKLLQKSVWNVQFNTSENTLACSGKQGSDGTPKASYESTGSGAGLESWGVEQAKPGAQELWFAAKNAFIGTEIAPNKKQSEEIESHAEGTKVLTIPVAQPAIAILFHLPAGCTVTGGAAKTAGTIALTQKVLQEIFQGKVTEWSKVLNKAKFLGSTTGTGKEEKKKEKEEEKSCKDAKITRVVREDGSGTTDSFKKYLNTIEKNKAVYENSETWSQNGEKTSNTNWPSEAGDPVVKGNGGGGLVTKVVETAGSIGYANVADARANKAFIPAKEGGTGGPGTSTFWGEVENGKKTYANPSTNGEVASKSNSNCEETVYTNGFEGKHTFPPPSTEELWNEVTISLTQKHYEPCYLTYDLALTHYKGADKSALAGTGETESSAPTEAEAQTVKDYIKYELSTGTGGGQEAVLGEDYLGDPTNATESLNVLKIAQAGAAKIGF